MTFPETRVDLNRLIKKMEPKLGNESFQNCKNEFSACTRVRTDGHTFFIVFEKERFVILCLSSRSAFFWKVEIFGFSSNSKSLKTSLFWRFQALKLSPFDPAWKILSNALLFMSNGGQEPELWPVLCVRNTDLSLGKRHIVSPDDTSGLIIARVYAGGATCAPLPLIRARRTITSFCKWSSQRNVVATKGAPITLIIRVIRVIVITVINIRVILPLSLRCYYPVQSRVRCETEDTTRRVPLWDAIYARTQKRKLIIFPYWYVCQCGKIKKLIYSVFTKMAPRHTSR